MAEPHRRDMLGMARPGALAFLGRELPIVTRSPSSAVKRFRLPKPGIVLDNSAMRVSSAEYSSLARD